MHYFTTYRSPIGILTLACDKTKNNLVGVWIEGQKYHGASTSNEFITMDDIPLFNTAKRWLDRYFEKKNPSALELPLAPLGSTFCQCVWNVLRKIPYGQLTTYGKIAKTVAQKLNKNSMSCQAVGGAVGHNPISIIIPCHRVIGAGGNLTGYAGGISRKIKLLELEGVDISKLFVPKNL